MTRGHVLSQPPADAVHEGFVEGAPVPENDKERHIRSPVQSFQIDDQAVLDFGDGLDDLVNLARAHAHAAAVDGGVGAAVNDAAAPGRGDLYPVPVAPRAGKVRKI